MRKSQKTVAAAPASQQGKIKSDFPKHSLEEALRVAAAIDRANAGKPYPPADVAIALKISPGSSEFRVLLSSSIKYGLTVGSYNSERVSIEDLGRSYLEPKSPAEKARALFEAALKPPTFSQMFSYVKGKKLPESHFLQNTITREFGVPREHAERCVAIFSENLEYVGLLKRASTGMWVGSEGPESALQGDETGQGEADERKSENLGAAATPRPAIPAEIPPAPTGASAIFLGHGKNKKPLEQLKAILDQYKVPYKIAIEEPNKFRPISEKVAEIMKSCLAAILIFTADEEYRDESGNSVWKPSENVVYELGASSILYGKRIIIFKEDAVTLPTNFRDIGYISFERDALAAKTNELFRELIACELIRVTVGT